MKIIHEKSTFRVSKRRLPVKIKNNVTNGESGQRKCSYDVKASGQHAYADNCNNRWACNA